MTPPAEPARRQEEMVDRQIAARGVKDRRVLDAMLAVPRDLFVDPRDADEAFKDRPLGIACGQTISQPYIVAFMAERLDLRPTDRVLEIGAGSGYAAAVMSRLAHVVWTVERHEELVATARSSLARAGITNAHVVEGDGSLGLPERAPFDAVSVACAGPRVPPALVAQLAPGGRLVMPVEASDGSQDLVLVRRDAAGALTTERLGAVRFVPLVGAEGFAPPPRE